MLCCVCQRNNSHILRAVNIPEAMKSATLLRQDQHLREATTERTAYQAACAYSKTFAEEHGITELGRSDNPPALFHYSFDFAQQLHYPANPLQPGPVFFKTPRKMQLFGVHAEGISRQVNYLIDEASSSGKGANVVVSLLHHFLKTYGVGQDHLELHADNCAGQNKNNHMMRYLMWRVATGLHKSGLHQLHGGQPHQVCPGLVFRPPEEDDEEDVPVITGRHRSSMQGVLCLQPLAVRRHPGWPSHSALLRLGDIPPRCLQADSRPAVIPQLCSIR